MGLGWWAWARLGLMASAGALQVLRWEEALTRLGGLFLIPPPDVNREE